MGISDIGRRIMAARRRHAVGGKLLGALALALIGAGCGTSSDQSGSQPSPSKGTAGPAGLPPLLSGPWLSRAASDAAVVGHWIESMFEV